jgi:D-lactate dehydrogenase
MNKINRNQGLIDDLESTVGKSRLLTSERRTRPYRMGRRVGGGEACAVVLPSNLLEVWRCLEICIDHNKIIIMQAANTGLTAGSTPYGNDYDREIVIINTLQIDDLLLLRGGEQVIAFAGSTLYQLEEKLRPLNRGPHSVIGSSCIGASVVGGVCNNSGGNLVNRGPAYTELSLYAQLTEEGELQLVNHLGIELGETPEDILTNLQSARFDTRAASDDTKMASDKEYATRVRAIEANSPARFNADKRRLYEASGCAGKLAVFAVRLDTFENPAREQVFYLGTNDPTQFTKLRKTIMSEFDKLPEMGEYMHRSYFDAADTYCKDTFIFIKLLGNAFLPKLFAFKAWLDGHLNRIGPLPSNFPDHVLQFLFKFWPDHLPKRMRDYRDRFEHHLMIVAADDIEATHQLLIEHFEGGSGEFFQCTEREGKDAQLHRFVAGGAPARYAIIHAKSVAGLMPLDIALPRNEDDWHNMLPAEVLDQLAGPFQLSHFFCQVLHWDFVVKKGVDIPALKNKILNILDERGAKYPAEHNVGHLYCAEHDLKHFYQTLDPTNSFNAGIGKTSKNKHYV